MMNIYQKELQTLRRDDEVLDIKELLEYNYNFIITSSHGYLVIPNDDENYNTAVEIKSSYSYLGNNAVYLEEDCDAGDFLKAIN